MYDGGNVIRAETNLGVVPMKQSCFFRSINGLGIIVSPE